MYIFANSKILQNSSRKSEILAKLNAPVNAELVKQLSRYLDDRYLKQEDSEVDNTDISEKKLSKESPEMLEKESSHKSSSSKPSSKSESSLDEKFDLVDDLKDEERSSQSQDSEEANLESSTDLTLDTVEGCIRLTIKDRLIDNLDAMKGSLNSVESTQGVNRIVVKDNELWVYYSDKVNLNNVMEQVIDQFIKSNYTYLEFNRLARSDNAIVFQILEGSSSVDNVVNDEK